MTEPTNPSNTPTPHVYQTPANPAQSPWQAPESQPAAPAWMPPVQETPKRKRRIFRKLFVGAVAAFGLIVLISVVAKPEAAVSAVSEPAYNLAPTAGNIAAPAQPAATGSRVVYEIVGARSAGTITYSAGQAGSIAQQSSAKLPWRKEFVVGDGSGFFVPTLSAQNSGSGSITCRITVDGEVVAEVTSEGQYTIASCSGPAI